VREAKFQPCRAPLNSCDYCVPAEAVRETLAKRLTWHDLLLALPRRYRTGNGILPIREFIYPERRGGKLRDLSTHTRTCRIIKQRQAMIPTMLVGLTFHASRLKSFLS
ncbi:unnamed protein product, partial [Ectocarpus sp. 12 AP-2014]